MSGAASPPREEAGPKATNNEWGSGRAMNKIRVAVVGTSAWAQAMHLNSLRSDPRSDLAAICGRDEGRARSVAGRYGIRKVYTDYEALLDGEDPDAVVVCVPNNLHHPMTLEALARGKHVLCEKPLALNVAEARQMFDLAARADVANMVCFTYRWMPTFRHIKALVDEGYVGRVVKVKLSYLSGFGRQPVHSWRFDSRVAGCGVLADLGSHLIDLARWYAGEIEAVSARLARVVERPDAAGTCDAEDSAALMLRYASGACGVIYASAVAWLGHDDRELLSVEVLGTEGSLWTDFAWDAEEAVRGVRVGEKAVRALLIPDELRGGSGSTDAEGTLQHLITNTCHGPRALLDAICAGASVTPSFYDGLKVQEVIEAGLKAQQEGRWVAVGSD